MKRKIALLLTFILALQLVPLSAQAQRLDFADMDTDHWAMDSLVNLERRGADVFQGIYENGNYYFRPTGDITRAQFAAILVRMLDVYDPTAENPFADVAEGKWYTSYVASAASAGIVYGTNAEGTIFLPDATMTRQEAMVMITRICLATPDFYPIDESVWFNILDRFTDADEIADWAMEGAAFVTYHRLITGINRGATQYQRPHNTLTRAEVAAVLGRVLGRIVIADFNVQTSIGDFPLGQSPESLLETLQERGLDLILPDPERQPPIENPVNDGRIYNHDGSFFFETDEFIFSYDSYGTQHTIQIFSPRYRIGSAYLGVGSPGFRVAQAFGPYYRVSEDPMFGHIIEYFDGDTFLFFVFDENDRIWSWGISTRTRFEHGD